MTNEFFLKHEGIDKLSNVSSNVAAPFQFVPDPDQT